MDDKNYVTVRERQKNAFEIRLEEALKQYSVVKVNDVNGAHHGEDYREMKQVILDIIFK
jgi:hypothetical protein